MDDYNYIHQNYDGFTTHDIATAIGENFQQSFSSESYCSYPAFNTKTTLSNSSIETSQNSLKRPAKQTKTNSWDSAVTDHVSPKPSSSSHILSFENSNSLPAANPKQFYTTLDSSLELKADEIVSQVNIHGSLITKGSLENQNFAPKASHGAKRTYSMTRAPPNAQDHIIAERKRREKLSQRFIALSVIVPGLKKVTDKEILFSRLLYNCDAVIMKINL